MRRNVFWALFATALMAWPLAGCGDDDTGPTCTDPCDTELATRCNGSTLQTCETNVDGCLDWADTTDCSASGQQCQHPVGEDAACVYDCTDECSEPDITQCDGSVIQTCTTLANTCLGWEDGTDCADSGQLCEDATGDAVCTDTCIDECTTLNDTQCAGTVIQTCVAGTDGCNDWVDTTDCADSSQICDNSSGTPTCVVDCTVTGPAAPTNPSPADGATNVDASISIIDWSDSSDAVSWDYYFGACPVPAYPDPAFVSVSVSEATGLTFDYNTSYCWQAVPLDSDGCHTEGPEWIFSTGACADPMPGAPQVTSATTLTLAPGSATYTLELSEAVVNMDMTALTWTPISGTGTLDSVTAVNAQTYDLQISGTADGDVYTLTVGTQVQDSCGNALSAAVDIQITIITGGAPGLSCAGPATTSSPNHVVDGNGHGCWTWPQDTSDNNNDHTFSCDSGVGGDVVIEYTTGPTDTALRWDATISNYQSSGYIRVEVTDSPCATGSSLYCTASASTQTDLGAVPVTPNTTYYIWVVDGYSNHYRPDISACVWSDSSCIDTVPGAPLVTSSLIGYLAGGTTGTYTLTFNEPTTNVNTTNVTLTPVIGSGNITSITPLDPYTYEVLIGGMSGGDQYTLTVGTGVADNCGTPLAAPVNVTLDVDPLEIGGDCNNPATVGSMYHSVDGLGHDCWTFPNSMGDDTNDHTFTCGFGAGGDIVIEYTTGPTDTALRWDTTISNVGFNGHIAVEVTDSPCASGVSQYCNPTFPGVYNDLAAIPVTPNTTYYIWVADGFTGNLRPTVDACIWSDDQCLDPILGPPQISSSLDQVFVPGTTSGIYTLTFNEWVTGVDMTSVTLNPIVGTGTITSITQINTQTYDVLISGMADGDQYELQVSAAVEDGCANPLVPATVDIWVEAPLLDGGDCSAPATTMSPYHSVNGLGQDCWHFPQSTVDSINDHVFTCDSVVGGDIVIEYTTGPTDTALYWDSTISNYEPSGYIGLELTTATCAAGASLHCASSSGNFSDNGVLPVTPNTTYYLWVSDGWSGHLRPTIDACLWSNSACIDPIFGPPLVTTPLNQTITDGSGTFQLEFNEDVTGVDLTSVTWTSSTGSATLDSVTQISPSTYELAYSGAVGSEMYTLTVSTAVADLCGNALAAPVDIQYDVVTAIYTDDFESACPGNWTLGGDWQCGVPTSGPMFAHSGTQVIATNLSGTYNNNQAWSVATATSGAYDLSTATTPVLMFWMWLDTEGWSYDGVNVKVSTNGVSFTVLNAVTPPYTLFIDGQDCWGGDQSAAGWQLYTADLSSVVGQSAVYIQIGLRTDSSVTDLGAYVDDLVILD